MPPIAWGILIIGRLWACKTSRSCRYSTRHMFQCGYQIARLVDSGPGFTGRHACHIYFRLRHVGVILVEGSEGQHLIGGIMEPPFDRLLAAPGSVPVVADPTPAPVQTAPAAITATSGVYIHRRMRCRRFFVLMTVMSVIPCVAEIWLRTNSPALSNRAERRARWKPPPSGHPGTRQGNVTCATVDNDSAGDARNVSANRGAAHPPNRGSAVGTGPCRLLLLATPAGPTTP